MKLTKSLIVAALVGAVTIEEANAMQRHHHHHNYIQTSGDAGAAKAADAETAGDAGAADAADAKAAAKEAVKEDLPPTAEEVKKEAAAVLKPKPADQSTEAQR